MEICTTNRSVRKWMELVPTKLVFKKKDEIDESVRFKARCVTMGFMKGLEGRFKITGGGFLLKKHLGVDYEWGVLPNGKLFCKATMDKKVNTLVEAYEKYIGKEVKIYETPGKPHKYLSKSEDDEPVDIDQYRSFVGQLMFFTTKLYPKSGTSTRALSEFMSNPNETHCKSIGSCGWIFEYVQPESFRVLSLADSDYGKCPETR